jgi:hypothetical protein
MGKARIVNDKRKILPAELKLDEELAGTFEREVGLVEFVDVSGKGWESWMNCKNQVVFRLTERNFEQMMVFVRGISQLPPYNIFEYVWDGDNVVICIGW